MVSEYEDNILYRKDESWLDGDHRNPFRSLLYVLKSEGCLENWITFQEELDMEPNLNRKDP